MFVRKTMTFSALSLMGALLLGLFGCGSNSSVGPGSNTTASARAFNALVGPNTTTVSFDQRATTAVFEPNVAYGKATSYTTVAAGNGVNNYVVATSGQITSASYNVSPNADYTLVAFGDYTQAAGSPLAPAVSQFLDSIPTASSLGSNAAVRVINVAAFTNAAYQNIDLYNAGQPLSGSALTGIGYGNATTYQSLPAGTYNITAHSHANNTLLPLPTSNTTFSNLTLTAGKAYTIFAIGTDNATFTAADPFNLVIVADD